MKKLLIVIVAIAVCVWLASDIWARAAAAVGVAVAGVAEEEECAAAAADARGGGARPGGGGGARVAGALGAAADRAMLLPALRRCRGHRLRMFADRVVAKWQTIGRWPARCP